MERENIAAFLTARATEFPDNTALLIPDGGNGVQKYTYRQLDENSDFIARGLQEIGIARGTRTALMVPPGFNFFTIVFALFKTGAVLVGIDPGLGVKNIGRCLSEAEPAAFIGTSKAHLARRLGRWAAATLRCRVATEPLMIPGRTIHLHEVHRLGVESNTSLEGVAEGEDTAAILFTSGSTGAPKGVTYTHANFCAQVRALQNTFDIQPGEVDLATFPLFGLYGPVLGMTSVIPSMDFTRPGQVDAEMIIETINNYSVTTMFGSPALLDRVGRWGEKNSAGLKPLKRVLCAGAPVAPAVLKRFGQMLDADARIHTPYGATEALPVSSIDSVEILNETGLASVQGKGTCVGTPVDGMSVRIISINDDAVTQWDEGLALDPSEIGEIIVKGPQVSRAYFNRASANHLAKISVSADTFFHRMGDLGYMDESGRLWFCGRKSQRVVGAERTWYTIPCEAVFNNHPQVYRTALVGIHKGGSTVPLICVELEPDQKGTDKKNLIRELLELAGRFEHTAEIRDFLIHPGFPVDIRHNAKIGRERLALWAQKNFK